MLLRALFRFRCLLMFIASNWGNAWGLCVIEEHRKSMGRGERTHGCDFSLAAVAKASFPHVTDTERIAKLFEFLYPILKSAALSSCDPRIVLFVYAIHLYSEKYMSVEHVEQNNHSPWSLEHFFDAKSVDISLRGFLVDVHTHLYPPR